MGARWGTDAAVVHPRARGLAAGCYSFWLVVAAVALAGLAFATVVVWITTPPQDACNEAISRYKTTEVGTLQAQQAAHRMADACDRH